MTKRDKPRSDGAAEMDKLFRRARRRTLVAVLLVFAALIVAVQHLLAHAGWQPIPMRMAKQDLLIGYPLAGLFGIAALFVWGNTEASGK